MQRRDRIVLQKVVAEINVGIELLGQSTMEEFLSSEMQKRALGMTTINVGELVKNVSSKLKEQYTEIPWKAIAGMRDITAHKYQTLRMEDVYNTVKMDFPVLKRQIESILND